MRVMKYVLFVVFFRFFLHSSNPDELFIVFECGTA